MHLSHRPVYAIRKKKIERKRSNPVLVILFRFIAQDKKKTIGIIPNKNKKKEKKEYCYRLIDKTRQIFVAEKIVKKKKGKKK